MGSSIQFLLSVCHNDAILLRRAVERCPGWNDFVRNNSGIHLERKVSFGVLLNWFIHFLDSLYPG